MTADPNRLRSFEDALAFAESHKRAAGLLEIAPDATKDELRYLLRKWWNAIDAWVERLPDALELFEHTGYVSDTRRQARRRARRLPRDERTGAARWGKLDARAGRRQGRSREDLAFSVRV